MLVLWATVKLGMAHALLNGLCMGWICQHCGAPFVDTPHRVVSEESGVILLDLIVCPRCHVQAQKLGLRSEELSNEIKRSVSSERQARH